MLLLLLLHHPLHRHNRSCHPQHHVLWVLQLVAHPLGPSRQARSAAQHAAAAQLQAALPLLLLLAAARVAHGRRCPRQTALEPKKWLPPHGRSPAVKQSQVRLHAAGRRLEPTLAASETWLQTAWLRYYPSSGRC